MKMNLYDLGQTRSSRQAWHLLHTPDTFVRAPLPGMKKATAIVHAAPANGAAFTQYTAELEPGGNLGPAGAQRFVFVIEGEINASGRMLHAGQFAYLPSGDEDVTAVSASRAAVIEKPRLGLSGAAGPAALFGDENTVAPRPLLDDATIEVRVLIPEDPAFDFAVNTMTFLPGAALPMVEVHV